VALVAGTAISGFRVDLVEAIEDILLLTLHGELDLASMPEFEAVIQKVNSAHHEHVVVDLQPALFISVDGFDAIGTLAFRARQLTIYARGTLAARVLHLLNYDRFDNLTVRTKPTIN
jgi:anti-anti-sigma regulatory factor